MNLCKLKDKTELKKKIPIITPKLITQ